MSEINQGGQFFQKKHAQICFANNFQKLVLIFLYEILFFNKNHSFSLAFRKRIAFAFLLVFFVLNLIYNRILKLVVEVKQSNNIIFKEEWEWELAPLPCCIAAGPDSSENTKWILYHAEIYIIHLGCRSKCHVLTLFHSRFNLKNKEFVKPV